MPRITIQQFRDRLTGAGQDTAAQAYREIARRPELARAMGPRDWGVWTTASAPQPAT